MEDTIRGDIDSTSALIYSDTAARLDFLSLPFLVGDWGTDGPKGMNIRQWSSNINLGNHHIEVKAVPENSFYYASEKTWEKQTEEQNTVVSAPSF